MAGRDTTDLVVKKITRDKGNYMVKDQTKRNNYSVIGRALLKYNTAKTQKRWKIK